MVFRQGAEVAPGGWAGSGRVAVVLPLGLTLAAQLVEAFFLHFENLLDHRRGYGVEMGAGPHQQGLGHRQGKRQVEPEGRALTRRRDDFDAAAEAATSVLTTSMPTPRPAIWVTSRAVEKPGWKMKSNRRAWSAASPGASSPGLQPGRGCGRRQASRRRSWR